jgi:hypothetical protein
MATRWTRRAVLSGCAGFVLQAARAAANHFPAESVAYLDASTEFRVVRLTDPACANHLPELHARALGRKGDFHLPPPHWQAQALHGPEDR